MTQKLLSDENVVLTIACMFQGFTPNAYWKGAVKNQNPEKLTKALDLINTQKRLYAEMAISLDAEALMRVGNKSDNHRSHVPAYKAIIEEQMARIK